MIHIDGEEKISNDDYEDVIMYSNKLVESLHKSGMKDTAKEVAKFMNEIVGYMKTRLGEQVIENMMKNISVDWLFDYFF